jgi:hypothetical protein
MEQMPRSPPHELEHARESATKKQKTEPCCAQERGEQQVYIYIHTYIHTYIYIYIHTCMHTYIHTYICIYIYIRIGWTSMYVYIYVLGGLIGLLTYVYNTYIYIHIYLYIYVCMYVCDTHTYDLIRIRMTSYKHLSNAPQESDAVSPKQYAVSYASDPLIRIRMPSYARMTSYAHLSRAPSGTGGTVPQATRCFFSGTSPRCGHPRCQGTHTIKHV